MKFTKVILVKGCKERIIDDQVALDLMRVYGVAGVNASAKGGQVIWLHAKKNPKRLHSLVICNINR